MSWKKPKLTSRLVLSSIEGIYRFLGREIDAIDCSEEFRLELHEALVSPFDELRRLVGQLEVAPRRARG